MAYTVRTDERDEDVIQQAKEHLGERSATKAMIEACKQVPRLDRERRSLQDKVRMLEYELSSIRELLRRKLEADAALASAIKRD